jgi:hypothetical protein
MTAEVDFSRLGMQRSFVGVQHERPGLRLHVSRTANNGSGIRYLVRGHFHACGSGKMERLPSGRSGHGKHEDEHAIFPAQWDILPECSPFFLPRTARCSSPRS